MPFSLKRALLYGGACLLLALLAPMVMAGPVAAAPAADPAAPRLCRFGFGVVEDITPYDVSGLRAGWYVNWLADLHPARPSGMRYVPIIGFRGPNREIQPSLSGAALAANVAANPGSIWIVGNEPDRRDLQDDLLPAEYARLYHDTYYAIKALDPTAKIAAGSIVQPSPLRLQYLDLVLNAYQSAYHTAMPVDIWNIHNFILNEQGCDGCWGAGIPPGIDVSEGLVLSVDDNDNFSIFKGFIVAFRQWMAARGYRDRPLMISEYGVQMPWEETFPPARVNAYMNSTFWYLRTATDATIGDPADNNRLVQRWAWYSLNDYNMNGWLYSEGSNLRSVFGDNYAAFTAGVPATINLKPTALWGSRPNLSAGMPITLTARLASTGDGGWTGPATVRFYSGDPALGGTQQIGADQAIASLDGCGDTVTAQVTWSDPPAGAAQVWVVVDPDNTIAEANETDNTLSVRILASASAAVFLPRISNGTP
jgi:hypothetical protein